MRIVRILAIGLLAAGAACSPDSDGVLITPDPVGGLRYVNLVSDTGAMDFRIVDIVGDAPNAVSTTFRTGGLVFGTVNPSPSQPPYQPVRAGTRNIRVFMSGTTAAVASTQMFDTTFTFVAGTNYTFFMYGTARTGVAGRCCSVAIVKDSVPAVVAGQYHVRVINFAPDMAPTLATPNVDVFIDTLAAGATPVGTANFANVAFGEVRPYITRTARPAVTTPAPIPALNYRAAWTASGTATPFVVGDVPTGTVGSATSNPFAGEIVAGTAISVVLTPRSVAGSQAPQTAAFTTPAAIFLFDRQPPRTAP